MKFRPLGAELFHVNGHTDTHRHDEANSRHDTPTRKCSVTLTIIIKSSDISNKGPQYMMQDFLTGTATGPAFLASSATALLSVTSHVYSRDCRPI